MFAYWPGKIRAGSINQNLIDFTDFVPTLLDAVGAETKEDDLLLDGISFYPQLIEEAKPKKVREWVYCHYAPNWGNFEPRTFIQNTRLKLYKNGEIYRLTDDLYEKQPLQKSDLDRKSQKVIKNFEKVLFKMGS
jgi:arylsulfatase A-like enzyme